jgi:hypothetical protein
MIEIVVQPTMSRTGRYRVCFEGGADILLISTRVPFFASARELLRRGHDPKEMLRMRHRGSPVIAMQGPLGEAAKWTVRENERQGPVVVAYEAFSRDSVLT